MRRRPSDRVRTARANVQLAAQICRGADLSGLQRALNLLETTVAEMREAEAEVHSGVPNDATELRRETELLKREIEGIMRVIDGCAAMCRGLSMRLGLTSLAYTPKGVSVAPSPSAAACELQG
jgi:hypothetical protein